MEPSFLEDKKLYSEKNCSVPSTDDDDDDDGYFYSCVLIHSVKFILDLNLHHVHHKQFCIHSYTTMQTIKESISTWLPKFKYLLDYFCGSS